VVIGGVLGNDAPDRLRDVTERHSPKRFARVRVFPGRLLPANGGTEPRAMEKRVEGAWIIHHSRKLRGVQPPQLQYEQLDFAGRCGVLLSALAGSRQLQLSTSRLNALARANGVSMRLEMPAILDELQRRRLIDRGPEAIEVLGLTSRQTLEHTASIFSESSPEAEETASLELAEQCSQSPVAESRAKEYIGDAFKLSRMAGEAALLSWEQIGFLDVARVDEKAVYFNGNLFRREDIGRVQAVLATLTADEERKVAEASTALGASGCLPKEALLRILGARLYSKMCSIGFLDENTIGNESGTFTFVTRPSAFCKFAGDASAPCANVA